MQPVRTATTFPDVLNLGELSTFFSAAAGARTFRREPVCWRRRGYHVAKRILDVTICVFILPFVLAAMAVCALLVWLDDSRPVLFCQKRTGRGGKRFTMYKFRTMIRDAEKHKERYAHLNATNGPDFKVRKDPRVTRAGRWLRKLSLDELPQLFNILKGDMSLVGPRPTSFDASKYDLWQTERLEVQPGITGLAQITGRSDINFDRRLELDLEYLVRRSFWFDLWILYRTTFVMLSLKGAY